MKSAIYVSFIFVTGDNGFFILGDVNDDGISDIFSVGIEYDVFFSVINKSEPIKT